MPHSKWGPNTSTSRFRFFILLRPFILRCLLVRCNFLAQPTTVPHPLQKPRHVLFDLLSCSIERGELSEFGSHKGPSSRGLVVMQTAFRAIDQLELRLSSMRFKTTSRILQVFLRRGMRHKFCVPIVSAVGEVSETYRFVTHRPLSYCVRTDTKRCSTGRR